MHGVKVPSAPRCAEEQSLLKGECFGKERLEEHLGKSHNMLSLVLQTLQLSTGGEDRASKRRDSVQLRTFRNVYVDSSKCVTRKANQVFNLQVVVITYCC